MDARQLWIALSIAVLPLGAQPQLKVSIVLPDGEKHLLPCRAIGGYMAVGLGQVSQLWNGRARLSPGGSELFTPEGTLSTAPQSFFLFWTTTTGSASIQLPVPVQSDGKQLYVPLPALLEALSALWNVRGEWESPTEIHLRRPSAPNTSPPTAPAPRIAPLPIPPDTGSAPKVPSLPRWEPDSAAMQGTASLLAAVGTSSLLAPVRIRAIAVQRSADTLHVRFTADGTIEHYQRPEWHAEELIVRIPGALHAAASPSEPAIERFQAERIREILRYRIRFRSPIIACFWAREGRQTIRISVLLSSPAPEAQRWELDVIVIDPGHGGKDDGAIGVNGKAEKAITLAVALKLRQLLRQMLPNTRVVLTREEDRFVPLYRRGQIANEHRGKLFISLHCNAAPTRPHPARGIETYVLRPGRTPEAIRVAERENAVIRLEDDPQRYASLSDEQHILATLAQSAFMRLSDRLAALVQQQLVSTTGLPDRGIQQAGFYVLMGASMPSVLVEMGFLSNPADAAFLASPQGQWKIARALAEALRLYAAEYASQLH